MSGSPSPSATPRQSATISLVLVIRRLIITFDGNIDVVNYFSEHDMSCQFPTVAIGKRALHSTISYKHFKSIEAANSTQSDIKLSICKTGRVQVNANFLERLALAFVDGHCKCQP